MAWGTHSQRGVSVSSLTNKRPGCPASEGSSSVNPPTPKPEELMTGPELEGQLDYLQAV